MVSARAVLKTGVEALVVSSGATRAARKLRRGQAVVLAYHNVVPDAHDGRGQRTLHVPVSRFRRHLNRLSETHRIVSLKTLVDGSAWEQDPRRPLAVLTFDDAYSGALTLGVRALVDRGLPATVFVSPGLLGGQAFWWDVVADRRGGVLPESVRTRALEEEAGDQRRILNSRDAEGGEGSSLPASLRSGTEAELASAASSPGLTLASHGWNHLCMPRLGDEELERELRRPLAWLGERWQGTLPVLSYPYGSYSSSVHRRARDVGYAAAFRIRDGWITEDRPRAIGLPRVNIPSDVSLRGLEITTSGLWPGA